MNEFLPTVKINILGGGEYTSENESSNFTLGLKN